MTRFLMALCLSVVSHTVSAQDALFDLAGNWAGSGTYLDRNIDEDIRCRISVVSETAATTVVGVCASARRNEDINLRIIRNADGSLTSQQEGAGGPVLDGVLEETGLLLSGRRGAEDTRLAMQLTGPDTMEMTMIISTEARTQTTNLVFRRR